MELTFEVSKQIGTGEYPIITHLKDNTIVLFYQSVGKLLMKQGEFIADTPNDTTFGAETVMSTDFTPQEIHNIRFSGGQNWMSWNSGDEQRVALFPESPLKDRPRFLRGYLLALFMKAGIATYDQPDFPQSISDWGSIDFRNGFILGSM